ncbi:MAG: hypothetical protein WBD25_00570 [Terriglobales bacterium]
MKFLLEDPTNDAVEDWNCQVVKQQPVFLTVRACLREVVPR